MIPKTSKFPMRTDFIEFRRGAKRLSSPHFTLHCAPSQHNSSCSVVVPKKINKRATTRNWLKRLTFDTIWPIIEDLGLDVVIIYKPIKLEKSTSIKNLIVSEISSLEF